MGYIHFGIDDPRIERTFNTNSPIPPFDKFPKVRHPAQRLTSLPSAVLVINLPAEEIQFKDSTTRVTTAHTPYHVAAELSFRKYQYTGYHALPFHVQSLRITTSAQT